MSALGGTEEDRPCLQAEQKRGREGEGGHARHLTQIQMEKKVQRKETEQSCSVKGYEDS